MENEELELRHVDGYWIWVVFYHGKAVRESESYNTYDEAIQAMRDNNLYFTPASRNYLVIITERNM